MLVIRHNFIVTIVLGLLFNIPQNTSALGVISSLEYSNEADVGLILQTQVDRLVLGDAFGIQKNNVNYLGMQNLFDLLDFRITVNIKNKSAKGWFITEGNTFFMEELNNVIESIEIITENSNVELDQGNFLYREDDIYIEASTIFKILEIEYKINTNTLTLLIFPSKSLPIQDKLARKKRKKPKFKNLHSTLPKKNLPYKLWTIPFTDIQTRYISNNLGYSSSSYAVLGAGDLAYMTGTYYLQGDDTDNLRYFRMKLSRDSLDNNLLGPLKATHFSFGEINPNAGGGVGSARQEVGTRISNKPFGRNIRLQQTDFIGDTQPNWDVELYRNNLFIDGQTVGDSGRYEFFNQSIFPGKNVFKLIFYGPEGQRIEKTDVINIEQGSTSTGNFFYDISLSKQRSSLFEFRDNYKPIKTDDRRLNINLFRDLNQYISLQATYSRFTFLDGTKHNFIKPAIRIFALNTLLFSNITKDINGGYSAYYSLSKSFWKQSLTYSNQNRSEEYLVESSDFPTSAQVTQTISLSGPLVKTPLIKIDYGLDAGKNIIKEQTSNTYKANFSASAFKLTVTNSLRYIENKNDINPSSKTILGNSNLNRSFYPFNLRAGADYALNPTSNIKNIKIKKLNKLFGNISWLISHNFRTQYGYNYTPQTKAGSHSFRFNLRTKKFSFYANYTLNSNSTYTIYAGINFSLSYDNRTPSLKISSKRISRTGAISAKIFIDDNNNGLPDHDEPVIKNAKINIEQARIIGKTDKNGALFLPGLPVNLQTDVQMDNNSLKDPFLVPAEQGYSFVPRPGVVDNINIPLVTSGEIEGTIYLENANGSKQTVGYVPLELVNIKTRRVKSEFSAYDGFYLFSSVPPGKYLISIDRSYLKRYKFGARKPMPRVINIKTSGNVEMGNDFSIYVLAD